MTFGVKPSRNRSRADDQRGAVLVEAAMIFMLLFMIIFGIVEFGLQLKDSQSITNAVRAAVRSASADPRDANNTYNTVAVTAEAAGQKALGAAAPQILWVYKADPATGYAIGDSPAGSFTSCTYCEIYNWDRSQSPPAWKCVSGCAADGSASSWLSKGSGSDPSAQYVCTSDPTGGTVTFKAGTNTTGAYSGPDTIGVYLKITHQNITGFFGSTKTMTDHAVARLEPVALNEACWG